MSALIGIRSHPGVGWYAEQIGTGWLRRLANLRLVTQAAERLCPWSKKPEIKEYKERRRVVDAQANPENSYS